MKLEQEIYKKEGINYEIKHTDNVKTIDIIINKKDKIKKDILFLIEKIIY